MTARATLRTPDSNSQPISPSKQPLAVAKPHSQLLSQAETLSLGRACPLGLLTFNYHAVRLSSQIKKTPITCFLCKIKENEYISSSGEWV